MGVLVLSATSFVSVLLAMFCLGQMFDEAALAVWVLRETKYADPETGSSTRQDRRGTRGSQ